MADAIDETIKLLDGEGVTQVCETVESWSKAGRWQDLGALATALEERCPTEREDAKKRARFEAALDYLEDQLALCAGAQAIDTLLALSQRDRARSVVVPRTRSMRVSAFASRLGFGQTAEAFLSALERAGGRPEHQEIFACWMHEVILRGTSLAKDARATRFRDALASSGHPLAAMPLELRATEREVPSYMPLYGDKGLGRAIDTLTSGTISVRSIPPPANGAAVRAICVDDAAVNERIRTAVRPWAEGKSGKVEAKVFALTPSIEAGAVGSWLLRALPLESTAAVARLECSRTGAEGVYGPLFSAASNGGAYSSGLGGAYGRLAAWTSLGGLVGAPEDADIVAIDALASRCAFLTFRAPGPWFHDVAWDLGVAALRAGGATVAVLAATDAE
jgi:hypothetical protein